MIINTKRDPETRQRSKTMVFTVHGGKSRTEILVNNEPFGFQIRRVEVDPECKPHIEMMYCFIGCMNQFPNAPRSDSGMELGAFEQLKFDYFHSATALTLEVRNKTNQYYIFKVKFIGDEYEFTPEYTLDPTEREKLKMARVRVQSSGHVEDESDPSWRCP